jgi:hypothetical protein
MAEAAYDTAGSCTGTITAERDRWVAYLRLEDPPGLSPITTVGRYDSVEAAQVATDEVWGGHVDLGDLPVDRRCPGRDVQGP